MQWHDLLGAVLIDFFDDSPFVVETEVDLSLKKQFLDFVVIRKLPGVFHRTLPDGFAPLANHTLISFKSFQDTFDAWCLYELIGYYVNYRKQASAGLKALLPEDYFRLLGISARFPENLSKHFRLEQVQSGVYDINIGQLAIRLLVIRDLLDEPHNAMLKLFSMVPEQLAFACQHYHPVSAYTTGIVDNFVRMYGKEDIRVAKTLEELNRKIMREALESAPVEERLKGLTAEQRMKAAEELLKGLPAEERMKGLPAEEFLKALTPDEIEAYLRKIKREKPQIG